MSSRVTRSSARKSAEHSILLPPPPATAIPRAAAAAAAPTPAPTPHPPSRKRKASSQEQTSDSSLHPEQPQARHHTKRLKKSAARPKPSLVATNPATETPSQSMDKMSSSGAPETPGDASKAPTVSSSSSRKKSGKSRKSSPDQAASTPTLLNKRNRPSSSRSKSHSAPQETIHDTVSDTTQPVEPTIDPQETAAAEMSDGTDPDEHDAQYDEDDAADDPFPSGFLRRHGGSSSLSHTLRALSGMMSGMTSRLRNILENLKQRDDPSIQLIALQEFSELLLVSTEDNLAGHFSPEQYVKELVLLMQSNQFGEDNPEMMLLACRCIANMMEALPASTATVVYGGAVPILCQKLLEIQYIDVAEQALTTLEKISVEFPTSIVREGGLNACLTYLDFFATSTQRSAVTTAANCCRNIPDDSFNTVRDVMPILLGVLGSSDQKVVDQGCLCVSRIVESFKYQDTKLEEIISADLLRTILRLLLPGSSNLIGPAIHTQFLRVLSIAARASPSLAVDLIQMNVVDTLFQILTGVSPPADSENAAIKIDSVLVMQALIHRPREQVYETLNVICELLPCLDAADATFISETPSHTGILEDLLVSNSKQSRNQKRIKMFKGCKSELRHFAAILLPTLTDAYSSTVNLSVRQKVVMAQLKMLSFLDVDILEEALRCVPYASYLASILSQQDHPFLVNCALQAGELLLKRMARIYRYQFHREGVIAEIHKLAERQMEVPWSNAKPKDTASADANPSLQDPSTSVPADEELLHAGTNDRSDQEDADDDDEDIEEPHDANEENSRWSGSSPSPESPLSALPSSLSAQDNITKNAKQFLNMYESENDSDMDVKAADILDSLKTLASDISECYEDGRHKDGANRFGELAAYFEGDALESITSYELLTSNIVGTLLDVFNDTEGNANSAARCAFVEKFMGTTLKPRIKTGNTQSTLTPLSILVHKLQDLLSRSEHFEVFTVHHNAYDGNRSSAASMLAKQIRLRLVADTDSGIPRNYRLIMVSIHAIATFKALDDYLRPRITLAEHPRASRHRDFPLSASAAAATYREAMAALDSPEGKSTDRSAGSANNMNELIPSRSSSKKPSRSLETEPSVASAKEKQASSRRSSRKARTDADLLMQDTPARPSLADPSTPGRQTPLECADESRLSDDHDMDISETLQALVDSVEDDHEEEEEPSAVNMEVASSGKIAAHQEDGTRIATPTQSAAQSQMSTPLQSTGPRAGASGLSHALLASLAGRPLSYAAAAQAAPQDWHLEFTVNGKSVTNETTIYRAVHMEQLAGEEGSARSIWASTHTVNIKRVPGPPPAEPSSLTQLPNMSELDTSELPQSLEKNPTTAEILRLLQILHQMNSNVDDVLLDPSRDLQIHPEPLAQFVSTKLTAKLNRQLEEPLVVASGCLPSWSEDLARLYPFLFPFETRHLFLQSTSFGYSRSMTRWQTQNAANESRRDRHRDERPFLGRLQRQKVRLQRERLFESAIKVMEMYGASPSVLEVEYFDEVGTGLGPTLEFYSSVSKEFSKKKLRLWRENDTNHNGEYAFGSSGLFPAPMNEAQSKAENGQRVLQLFKILGKFVARSMLDSRIIDIFFNPNFFRVGDSPRAVSPSLGALKAVDAELAKSLQMLKQYVIMKNKIDEQIRLTAAQKAQKISRIEVGGARVEDLGLDFTLPGYPSIELVPNGSAVSVTIETIHLYIEKVIEFTLGEGVRRQIEAFRTGFSQVFPYSALWAFTPDELVMLFGQNEEDWSMENLTDSIKADHGYNLGSRSVRNLLQVMSEFSTTERRDFLQFVTGSPKLPIGGFKSLNPMLTVVCKPSEAPYTSDDYLPSVMTCVNYLKLPDYTTIDAMRARLGVATKEGQGAFHLS